MGFYRAPLLSMPVNFAYASPNRIGAVGGTIHSVKGSELDYLKPTGALATTSVLLMREHANFAFHGARPRVRELVCRIRGLKSADCKETLPTGMEEVRLR
jgi:hypothetical protein